MKNKICYVIMMGITLAVAVSHQNQFIRFLLGFEVLLAAALFVSARYMKKNIQAKLLLPVRQVQKGEPFTAQIFLENAGKLPAANVQVTLAYRDEYTGQAEYAQASAMLDAGGQAMVGISISGAFCGIVSLRLEKVVVYDYLKLFYGKCEFTDIVLQAAVLPDRNTQTPSVTDKMQQFLADGTDSADGRRGENASEIYDIRAFHNGDALHRIHWKLSAKTDDLLVREFGEQTENAALIFADLYVEDIQNLQREQSDHFMETIASLSNQMLKLGFVHYIVWFDIDRSAIHRLKVDGQEELSQALEEILRVKPYDESVDMRLLCEENFAYETLGEVFRVDFQGSIHQEKEK